jgi:hypothetical protein
MGKVWKKLWLLDQVAKRNNAVVEEPPVVEPEPEPVVEKVADPVVEAPPKKKLGRRVRKTKGK